MWTSGLLMPTARITQIQQNSEKTQIYTGDINPTIISIDDSWKFVHQEMKTHLNILFLINWVPKSHWYRMHLSTPNKYLLEDFSQNFKQ